MGLGAENVARACPNLEPGYTERWPPKRKTIESLFNDVSRQNLFHLPVKLPAREDFVAAGLCGAAQSPFVNVRRIRNNRKSGLRHSQFRYGHFHIQTGMRQIDNHQVNRGARNSRHGSIGGRNCAYRYTNSITCSSQARREYEIGG
jgi:hypothetical protein